MPGVYFSLTRVVAPRLYSDPTFLASKHQVGIPHLEPLLGVDHLTLWRFMALSRLMTFHKAILCVRTFLDFVVMTFDSSMGFLVLVRLGIPPFGILKRHLDLALFCLCSVKAVLYP